MDVRDDAAARDRRLDERVELLVSADGELQVARRDALYLEVLARVTRELEHLGREVLEDGRGVNSRGRADALVRVNAPLEEAVDAADWELCARGRPDRNQSSLPASQSSVSGPKSTDPLTPPGPN